MSFNMTNPFRRVSMDKPRRKSMDILVDVLKDMFGYAKKDDEPSLACECGIDVSFIDTTRFDIPITDNILHQSSDIDILSSTETEHNTSTEHAGMYITYYLSIVLDFLKDNNLRYCLVGHPNKPYHDTCLVYINENHSIEVKTTSNTEHECFAETVVVSKNDDDIIYESVETHRTSIELFEYLTQCITIMTEGI